MIHNRLVNIYWRQFFFNDQTNKWVTDLVPPRISSPISKQWMVMGSSHKAGILSGWLGVWGRRVSHLSRWTMTHYLYGRVESTCVSQRASLTSAAPVKQILAFNLMFCTRERCGAWGSAFTYSLHFCIIKSCRGQ